MNKTLIRFDWAIKKLLKNRADFVILEGFLTVLLNQEIKIVEVLESESDKETSEDKYNRVDLLVKNQYDERIIIEVQNSKELDYFHRMAYGTSKVITQLMKKGNPYESIKKVISITIAYFDLGHGEDYVYHGTNQFKGLHKQDLLTLTSEQILLYHKHDVHEIFPEYWIIKAEKFNDQVEDKLDEWIYFLKNSEVRDDFTAPGLGEAKEVLDELRMNEQERREYERYLKRLMDIASENHTKKADIQFLLIKKEKEGLKKGFDKGIQEGMQKGIQEGMQKGIQEGMQKGIEKGLQQGAQKKETELVLKLYENGMSLEDIAKFTQLTSSRVNEIIQNKS